MEVKDTVAPTGQPSNVTFTALAQLFGLRSGDGRRPINQDGERGTDREATFTKNTRTRGLASRQFLKIRTIMKLTGKTIKEEMTPTMTSS